MIIYKNEARKVESCQNLNECPFWTYLHQFLTRSMFVHVSAITFSVWVIVHDVLPGSSGRQHHP